MPGYSREVRPSTQLYEFEGALYVIDRAIMPQAGQPFVFELNGACAVGKLMGSALITFDEESIEGPALEEVILFGVVTHTITQLYNERP